MENDTITQIQAVESISNAVNSLEVFQELTALREKHGFFLGETVWFWLLHNDINSARIYEATVIFIHENEVIGVRFRDHNSFNMKEQQFPRRLLFSSENECRTALIDKMQVMRLQNEE